MKQGMAGVLLAAASAVMAVICIVLSIRADKAAPRLVFEASDVVYREDMDKAELLAGAAAYDSVDGDVTNRIVIEKIIENQENNTAVVFYAVSDRAGNAVKSSRVFPAVYIDADSSQVKDRRTEAFLTAGIDSEIRQIENDGSGVLPDEETEEAQSTQTPTPAKTPEQAPTARPIPTGQPTPAPTPTTKPTPEPAPTRNPSVPILTLKVSEVKVNAGQGPAWVDIIGTLSDDRDSYETLFGNLSVSKYDMNKAGRYPVSVYTEDSDGNRSVIVPLTIIVQ